MKFVSTSAFLNTAPEKIIVAGALHPRHVHKGARLSIGGDLPLEKLAPTEQRLVAELNIAGRIVEESQVETVAKIDAEVKADAAKSERK
jgi:hypothetical protein